MSLGLVAASRCLLPSRLSVEVPVTQSKQSKQTNNSGILLMKRERNGRDENMNVPCTRGGGKL
jgi:hypothetical protein